MRKTADVVVIGGGAAGTSVAYHLGKCSFLAVPAPARGPSAPASLR